MLICNKKGAFWDTEAKVKDEEEKVRKLEWRKKVFIISLCGRLGVEGEDRIYLLKNKIFDEKY